MDKLRKTLGLPALLFYGTGVIIGGGIYSILGPAAGVAGEALWISVLLAAIPAALTAVVYAELVCMFPRAGAAYAFVREALPNRRWASFAVGFAVAVTAAATTATVAIAFGGYLSAAVGVPAWAAALLLIAACTGVNIAGLRESTWVTIASTCIELGGLVIIVIAGVASERLAQAGSSPQPFAVFAGAATIFFVYTGFEGLANLSEECRKPERDLPIAMLVALGFTTLVYALVAVAAVSLLAPGDLAESDAPLAHAAAAADPRLGTVLGWIALFATGNTALITVIVASRLLYGMADEGDMPGGFARTLSKRRTPWIAALAIGIASAALLPLGGVAAVGRFSSLTTLLVFVAVSAALIIIRRSGRGAGAFHIPLHIGRTPVIPLAAIVAIGLLMTQFEWNTYLHALGALALGVGLHFTRGAWRGGVRGDGKEAS